ncbi:MAG: class II fructose-bisphosphatase [Actinobacteria bacterium]|mgnify:CR=1 FL=1|nr:MAG: class II fructose-bisphosphatase [Actinomycetota bacterium]REK40805.1 MAG: class II fructose-bisphosphatase [Actinomycetota bacterium]
MPEPVERNLGLDLVRVTETAAMGAARWLGRGDKEAADQAAVDGMRLHLSTLDIDGVVVIGEGEKDSAPMLFNGELVGSGSGLVVDVAVDPVDGTTLTAAGIPGAIAVIAIAEGRGTMYAPGRLVYMDKIAVGPEAAGSIDLEAPVEHNLKQVAKAKRKDVNDLRVLILDRPRNEKYINDVRAAGARISLIRDGDVAGAIATAQNETAADILMGIGGSPEAVLAASALLCMGGEQQCRLWPRDETEEAYAREEGLDLDQVLTASDMVASDNVFFAATGVTGGEYLRSVEFRGDTVVTHSVIMRSKTGSIRYMDAYHDLARLRKISATTLD